MPSAHFLPVWMVKPATAVLHSIAIIGTLSRYKTALRADILLHQGAAVLLHLPALQGHSAGVLSSLGAWLAVLEVCRESVNV